MKKCHKILDLSSNLDYITDVHSINQMTKEIMMSMLRKGSNGEEILKILNTIVDTGDAVVYNGPEPTTEWIEF